MGQALKDHPCKNRLIPCHIRDDGKALPRQFVVDALRHVVVQEERFGIHVDEARRTGARSSFCDQVLDSPGSSLASPGVHALLHDPHAVDIGMETEPAGCGALVGIARQHGFRLGYRRLHQCAYQRPCT